MSHSLFTLYSLPSCILRTGWMDVHVFVCWLQGKQATLTQLTDQALTQLFAGHETTGNAIMRIFLSLPQHPAVIQRLRDEQAALMARHGSQITGTATHWAWPFSP